MFHIPAHKQTVALPAQVDVSIPVRAKTIGDVVDRIKVSEAAHACNVFHMYAHQRVIASAQDSKRTVAL